MFNGLGQISSSIFTSSVTYLIPFVVLFWLIIDVEKLHLSQILTGGLILFEIYLENRGK